MPVAIAGAVALAATPGTRLAGATFVAQSRSPANGFTAATSFEKLRVATGSYTGNGADGRQITAGFAPSLVTVKGGAHEAVARSPGMGGAKPLGTASAFGSNLIQGLGASGFSVGTDARVNASGTTYSWIAFRAADPELALGSYTGNGSGKQIAGLGLSPEFVVVMGDIGRHAVQRISGMSSSYAFAQDAGSSQRITSLDADGFSVGSGDTVNAAGTAYAYAAWSETPGRIDVGSYPGTGTAGHRVSGLGLTPEAVLVRADDVSSPRRAVARPAALPGSESLLLDASANVSGSITALLSDGFELGGEARVNESGHTYGYAAFEDGGP